jgi:hypothetical protein
MSSVVELISRAKSGETVDIALLSQTIPGLKSSKEIDYDPEYDYFTVLHLIDGTEMYFDEDRLAAALNPANPMVTLWDGNLEWTPSGKLIRVDTVRWSKGNLIATQHRGGAVKLDSEDRRVLERDYPAVMERVS